jgi:5-methylcytosine-specific restriction endonuclease McrA
MSSTEAMRVYMLERYRRLRDEAIVRLGGHCVNCGSENSLEFDHIDPSTKEFTIASGWSTTEERLSAELNKCQLLCSDCHKEKSILESGRRVAKGTHGTVSSYRYCKCELCREANRLYKQNYKRLRSING